VPPLVEPGRHSIAVNGMDQHHRVSGSGPFDTRRPPSTPTTLALSLEPLRSLREAADDRVRIIDHEGLFWLSDAQWAVMVPHLPTRIADLTVVAHFQASSMSRRREPSGRIAQQYMVRAVPLIGASAGGAIDLSGLPC